MGKRRPILTTLLGLLAVDALFLVASVWLIDRYYETHLPHYDSMGSYAEMFRMMTTSARNGVPTGLSLAVRDTLSWHQSLFAALTGPLLPTVPSSMMPLNVLCLVGAQVAIVIAYIRLGAAPSATFLAGLLPFLPATFSAWNGGYPDMRRDLLLTLSLVACFFWSGLHALRPSSGVGLALGISAGLAVWARGNALPYVAITLLPAALTHLVVMARHRPSPSMVVSIIMVPLLPFLVLAVPFYTLTLQQILEKYLVGAYAIGFDRMVSLLFYMWTPVTVTFDARSTVPVLAIVGAIGVLAMIGQIRCSADVAARRPALWFASAGLAVCVLVVLFNSLVVGVSPLGGRFPYFPALVGLLGVLASSFLLLRPGCTSDGRVWRSAAATLVLGVAALLVIGSLLERTYLAANGDLFGYAAGDGIVGAERVTVARELSRRLSCIGRGKPTAFMWVGSVNRSTVDFYAAQRGDPRTINYEPIATSKMQRRIDLERPPDEGVSIESQQRDIEQSLDYADLIVLSEAPKQYDNNPMSYHFIYRHGRPIVERLLASSPRPVLYRFTFDDIPFVVLGREGQSSASCDG